MKLQTKAIVYAAIVVVHVGIAQAISIGQGHGAEYDQQLADVQARIDELRALRRIAQFKKSMSPEQKALYDKGIMEAIAWERKELELLMKLKRSEAMGVPCAVGHGDFECRGEIGSGGLKRPE